jgi:protease PrsW
MSEIPAKGLLGLAPVLIYLVALLLLDSYKLVRPRAVVLAIAAGWVAALACHWANGWLLEASGLSRPDFMRYGAPVTEELAKAVYLAVLIRRRQVGFSIDAAILGFAVGAGFGMLENVFYLGLIPDADHFTWFLRGCGTALMHGSTTAVFAILAHRRADRGDFFRWRRLLPGLLLAIVLHSVYNHFFLSPVATVVGVLVAAPLITIAVFQQSERSLERWLGLGFDTDAEMLAVINEGKLSATPVGLYLLELRERFPPAVVVDMMCLLRLQVELAIQAKGLLLMRKGGFHVPTPADVREKFVELAYLERSIGPTGRLALQPFLRRSRREAWQRQLLQ